MVVPRQALSTVKKFAPRDLMQRVTKFQPIPEYTSPTNPHWLLLRKILATWIHASRAPVLLAPIPMWMFINEQADPSYQVRFSELASEAGCLLHNPLPDLQSTHVTKGARFASGTTRICRRRGHQALALSLAPVIADVGGRSPLSVRMSTALSRTSGMSLKRFLAMALGIASVPGTASVSERGVGPC